MRILDEANAGAFLRDRGWLPSSEVVEIRRLAGGVSNEVLYISRRDGADFVVKQARPQLRVADPWYCGVERIWREVEVLKICEELLKQQVSGERNVWSSGVEEVTSGHLPSPLLPNIETPRILHEDRDNFCFAMSAAPAEHQVWKQQLLAGEADPAIAAACGRLLGALHARTWGDASIARRLDDRQVFDELRLDPYYRTVAARRPDVAPHMLRLVDSVWEHRRCLAHADFSPKNLLTWRVAGRRPPAQHLEDSDGMMMVDFETGHYGDPAFDIGFFLSHLVLKAFCHAPRHEPMLMLADWFWVSYAQTMRLALAEDEWSQLAARGQQNLAGCAWARLDGKSPVEYLTEEKKRDAVRAFCLRLFEQQPANWPAAKQLLQL